MLESLGESFTTLNTFLVVQFLVSGYLDTELISLFFMLTVASARYPSTSPLHCGLPATSCRGAVQAGGVCIGGSAFNCFSKICQRTYVWGPRAAFCFKGTIFYLLEVQKNIVMAFDISQSGISPVPETSAPSIYFQWWYQRGPREGGEADSSCRNNSPFLRKLCRVGVFGCNSWTWASIKRAHNGHP